MAGTLFVVATPIGNLEDITLRALRVLREVSVVAAEDTRRSGNLLRHFEIQTPLVSLHAHNERSRAPELIGRLDRGESVAVVSDAGTPGISDPGAELVRLARENGIRVEPVPGASAVAAAISAAGLREASFAFLGFPPPRSKDRKEWFGLLGRLVPELSVVFFEAPHRIVKTMNELLFLGDHHILAFREVTKVYEEVAVGSATSIVSRLSAVAGEFTIVVPRRQPLVDQQLTIDDEAVRRLFGELTEFGGLSPRETAREVGKRFGLSTRHVYELTKR